MNHRDLSLCILINRDTDIPTFEALFVKVKEVLLKTFFKISSTFIKSANVYTIIIQSHKV